MEENEAVGSVMSTVRWLTSVLKTWLRVLLLRTVGSRTGVRNSSMDIAKDDVSARNRPPRGQPSATRFRSSRTRDEVTSNSDAQAVQSVLDENGNPVEIELRSELIASRRNNMPEQLPQSASSTTWNSTSNRCGNTDISRSKSGETKRVFKVKSHPNGLTSTAVTIATSMVINKKTDDNEIGLSATDLLTRHNNDDNKLVELLEAAGDRSTLSVAINSVVSARKKRSNRKKARRRGQHIAAASSGDRFPVLLEVPKGETLAMQRKCDDDETTGACDVGVEMKFMDKSVDLVATTDDVMGDAMTDCHGSTDRRSDGDGEDEDTAIINLSADSSAERSVAEIKFSSDIGARSSVVIAGRSGETNCTSGESGRGSRRHVDDPSPTNSHQHRDRIVCVAPLLSPTSPSRTRKPQTTPETQSRSSMTTGRVHSNVHRTATRNDARQGITLLTRDAVENCLNKSTLLNDDGSRRTHRSTFERPLTINSSAAVTNDLTVADSRAADSSREIIPKLFDADATRAFLYDAFQEVSRLSARSRHKGRRFVVFYADRFTKELGQDSYGNS